MKICILSYPRTGSTLLHNFLSQKFQLTPYGELLDNDFFDKNKYSFLEKDMYIVKIMGFDFYKYDFDNINWKSFDKFYITERKNLTDAFASWYLMDVYKKNICKIKFEIPKNFLIQWMKHYNFFLEIKKKVLNIRQDCKILFYEDIIIDEEICKQSFFKKTELDYKIDCKNYWYFDEKIKKYFDIQY